MPLACLVNTLIINFDSLMQPGNNFFCKFALISEPCPHSHFRFLIWITQFDHTYTKSTKHSAILVMNYVNKLMHVNDRFIV